MAKSAMISDEPDVLFGSNNDGVAINIATNIERKIAPEMRANTARSLFKPDRRDAMPPHYSDLSPPRRMACLDCLQFLP